MSVLRNIESKIADLVEGAFSRAFRSEVRPVEIARKLAREMEEHQTVSVSRTYVPNEYTVWLSPQDRAQFEGFEDQLQSELSGYLLEHARRERYALLSRPVIHFDTDDRLNLGEFGIQARLVRPADSPQEQPRQGDHGQTMVFSTAERVRRPLADPGPGRRMPLLTVNGKRMPVGPRGAMLGRSRDCDIVLDDANVSRRHAELRPDGDHWTIADLKSTNGVKVNGRRIDRPTTLQPGDELELGTSTVVFDLE